MSAPRPELRLGRIVWARLADFRGIVKRRPAIVISATNEITPDQSLSVMAISTSYPDPPPRDHVELPWHPDKRRVSTRLGRRSAAVITWLRTIEPNEVEEFAGDIPTPMMIDILSRLRSADDRTP